VTDFAKRCELEEWVIQEAALGYMRLVTDFAKRCELEALCTERDGMLACNAAADSGCQVHRYTHDQITALSTRMRALAEPDTERLPDWAKPLMRHVRNFCTTHHGSDNPDLLRMIHAWDALTDEQRLQCGVDP
jgi:hypothetical protein